jgi:hypothetical protein
MIYIKRADLEVYIQAATLDKLAGGSGTSTARLDNLEKQQMATFRKYVGGRYDVDAIYASITGTGGADIRDQYVVKCLCHMMIYALYTPLAPHEIPEHRKFDYQEVMEFLASVRDGKSDVDFPRKTDSETEETLEDIRFSSYPKLDHKF